MNQTFTLQIDKLKKGKKEIYNTNYTFIWFYNLRQQKDVIDNKLLL